MLLFWKVFLLIPETFCVSYSCLLFTLLRTILTFLCSGDGQRACPSRDLSLIEEGRRCRKACQVDSDCNGAQKRCLCDDACGFSCFNSGALKVKTVELSIAAYDLLIFMT